MKKSILTILTGAWLSLMTGTIYVHALEGTCVHAAAEICVHAAAGGKGIQKEEEKDSSPELRIMFWNLENFFDYFDSGENASDAEFSARGSRHWGKKKFLAKCSAVAKTLMWVGDREKRMPDIFAVAEVENRFVLRKLTEDTMVRKMDYKIVHYESPDPRGIDVALLYRSSVLELEESRPVRIEGLATRDILLAKFRIRKDLETGDYGQPKEVAACRQPEEIAVLVNHHPSKYGGGDTDWRRNLAIGRLKAVMDSLMSSGMSNIVAAGDFNDVPENTVLGRKAGGLKGGNGDELNGKEGDDYINLAAALAARGEGTIRYNGKWELIDMFFVSRPLADKAEMEILKVPFLMVRDNVHSGEKPLRTYSGPRYIGGVSDHCPILLRLKTGSQMQR